MATRTRTRLTDELKKQIIEDFQTDKTTSVKELSEMYGVCIQTIYNVLKAGLNVEKIPKPGTCVITTEDKTQVVKETPKAKMKKTIPISNVYIVKGNRMKQKPVIIDTSNDIEIGNLLFLPEELNMVPISKPVTIVEAVLVNNRHDFNNLDKSIFDDTLDEDLMFDFKKQYEICKEFLQKNVRSGQTLICYLTGIQSALCSLFKACMDNHTNLICKNYNSKTKEYESQTVIDIFGDIKDTCYPFTLLENEDNKIYIPTGKTVKDLIDADECYVIHTHNYDNNKNIASYFILDNEDEAWLFYRDQVKNIKDDANKNIKMGTILGKILVFEDGYHFKETISKSYNYSMQTKSR